MSLDKAIKHGKERRKQYRGSRAFDSSCRHGGSCDHCARNRRIADKRVDADTELEQLESQDEPADK